MLSVRVLVQSTLKQLAKRSRPGALQVNSSRPLSYQLPSWLAKGFEHYDKKSGQNTEKGSSSSSNNANSANNKNTDSNNTTNKSTSNKDKKSGDGNKKDNGNQNPFDPDNNSTRILLVGAALGLSSLYMVEEMQKGGR
ncbi:hypothetical protein EON65_48510 [archaeon]|nr:MAG: hypothetical protein EON65_48510 [archaeon]